jgi:phospholipase D1/2
MSSSQAETGKSGARRRTADWLRLLLPLAVFVVLAAAWQLTPLGDHTHRLGSLVTAMREWPLAPLAVVVVYVIAGLLMVPLTALVLGTVVGFGGMLGGAYAMLGSLASATAAFFVGRAMGRGSVQRLLGERARRAMGWFADNGVLSVAVVRNMPVAPYSIVNIVAGATEIRLVTFLAGTFIGLLPGIVAFAIFGQGIAAFVRNPDAATAAVVLAGIAALVGVSFFLGRWLTSLRARRNG